jgi:hypothetical protein
MEAAGGGAAFEAPSPLPVGGKMVHKHLYRYVANKYPSEYRLVIEGGRLTDDWSNVAAHCFLQALAAEIVGDLLGLEQSSINRLSRTAACHDLRKRLDKRPSDFDEKARTLATHQLVAANLDEELMAALEPSFLILVSEGKASLLQLIQFLIDDMTMNDQFVTFDERVREAQERTPDPDPRVREILGRTSYWDAEREIGHDIENMLFAICAARRLRIVTPVDLVTYVNREIEKRLEAEHG